MPMSRSFLAPYFLLLLLCLVGCGGSGGGFAFAPMSGASGPSSPSDPLDPLNPTGPTATVELQSVLAQTVVPTEVASLRASGYDQEQVLHYGPVTQEKAAVVQWTQVPVEVTDFVIEYLDAEGQIVGLAQVAVQLFPNETLVVDNPTILGVSASLQQLSLTPASRTIALGTSTQFTATGAFSDGTSRDLTLLANWSSSDPQVASVSQGTAQGLAEGNSTLTATFGGFSGQAQLTVTSATLESLRISPRSPAIAQGTSLAFSAEGFFSDGSFQDLTHEVEWSSSEPEVAEVAEQALAQGLQAGQTTISATFGDKSAETVLTVTSATLESLVVDGQTESIALGTSTGFTATGTFSDGSTQNLTSAATWEVDPPQRASVNLGTVTALSPGPVVVKAGFAGLSGQANLQITDAVVTTVRVESGAQDGSTLIGLGQTLNLKALATFSDGSEQEVTDTAVWSSEHPNLATVNAGVVTGHNPGQSFIEAAFGGQSGSLQVTVQAAPPIPPTPPPSLPDLVLSGGDFTFDTDSGELTPPSGDPSTPQGWNSDEGRLILRSFTLEDGATLNLTGSEIFKVKAETSIMISGAMVFNGEDGDDGEDGTDGVSGTDGTDGSPGGDINLFSSGTLTVTGTISANGGNGGHGGASDVAGNNGAIVSGGAGGRGGDSGQVILTAGDNLTVDQEALTMNGGDGGYGGDVPIQGNNNSSASATGGTGGDGGNGGTQGGDGGRGGDVDIGIDNLGAATGGSGGHGGTGETQGGAGGRGGNIDIEMGSIGTTIGGTGGHGGNGDIHGGQGGRGGTVVLGFFNYSQADTFGGDGGKGGDGGTQGGTGGEGGDVTLERVNSGDATGGAGGDGGEGASGGNGGKGGDVTILDDNDRQATATGGDGGDGGALNGIGGNGGDATVLGNNNGTAIGGNAGEGG